MSADSAESQEKRDDWWADSSPGSEDAPVFSPVGSPPATPMSAQVTNLPSPTEPLPGEGELGHATSEGAVARSGPGAAADLACDVDGFAGAPNPPSEVLHAVEVAEEVEALASHGQAPPVPTTIAPDGFSLASAKSQGQSAAKPTESVAVLVFALTPKRVRRGQVITLREARTVLGQGRGVGCLVDDPAVADYHAVIAYEPRSEHDGYYLYPGAETKCNGKLVEGPLRLASGDRLRLGLTELVFLTVQLA